MTRVLSHEDETHPPEPVLPDLEGSHHARQERRRETPPPDASGIAAYLLERRSVLDATLREQDRSVMSSVMRRTPPYPAALVSIEAPSTRERFIKLLQNANIETQIAETSMDALGKLERRIHAVLFTDDVALIRGARQLHAGAATHIVFVGARGRVGFRGALRAGANDCASGEPGGDEFWAHLTTVRRIVSLAASLQLALDDNRILSTVDELTRCGSRRFFDREFPREVARAVRLGRSLALVMCDIDHFKQVNDRYGHHAGDDVLRMFAERLGYGLRLGEDWVARIGGEEFAIVLPETSQQEACRIADRLRQRVAESQFTTSGGRLDVTASFGVGALAAARCFGGGVAETMIKAVDAALYTSKRSGRNRVSCVVSLPN